MASIEAKDNSTSSSSQEEERESFLEKLDTITSNKLAQILEEKEDSKKKLMNKTKWTYNDLLVYGELCDKYPLGFMKGDPFINLRRSYIFLTDFTKEKLTEPTYIEFIAPYSTVKTLISDFIDLRRHSYIVREIKTGAVRRQHYVDISGTYYSKIDIKNTKKKNKWLEEHSCKANEDIRPYFDKIEKLLEDPADTLVAMQLCIAVERIYDDNRIKILAYSLLRFFEIVNNNNSHWSLQNLLAISQYDLMKQSQYNEHKDDCEAYEINPTILDNLKIVNQYMLAKVSEYLFKVADDQPQTIDGYMYKKDATLLAKFLRSNDIFYIIWRPLSVHIDVDDLDSTHWIEEDKTILELYYNENPYGRLDDYFHLQLSKENPSIIQRKVHSMLIDNVNPLVAIHIYSPDAKVNLIKVLIEYFSNSKKV